MQNVVCVHIKNRLHYIQWTQNIIIILQTVQKFMNAKVPNTFHCTNYLKTSIKHFVNNVKS